MKKILIRNVQATGDGVMLTALLRDVHKTYPDQFLTCGDFISANAALKFNPYQTRIPESKADIVATIGVTSEMMEAAEPLEEHWLETAYRIFEKRTGLDVKLTERRGEIYLKGTELEPIVEPPYWIVFAGGKKDQTTKLWPKEYYQKVVDNTPYKWVQVGGIHLHEPLENVVNLIGKTSLRQLFTLVYWSDGILSPITSSIHISAALPRIDGRVRPTIVIAGGKESPHLTAYPGVCHINRLGHCSKDYGCWTHIVESDIAKHPYLLEYPHLRPCRKPVKYNGETFAECMLDISPEEVIKSATAYQSI